MPSNWWNFELTVVELTMPDLFVILTVSNRGRPLILQSVGRTGGMVGSAGGVVGVQEDWWGVLEVWWGVQEVWWGEEASWGEEKE